jgi:ABC-type Na+ efflux pump permease subunit
MNTRRVRAIYRKEMREFRRNKQIISTMAFSPIGFVVFPVIFLFSITASDANTLLSYPVQLFMLSAAALLPTVIGASSIAGEREQGTLEPVLGTPIEARELMLGKALAVFVPATAESYLIFGIIDACVWLFKPAAVSQVALRPPILLAQLLLTPLIVCLAVWLSMAISARFRDTRVAYQLSAAATLPVIIPLVLLGVNVIRLTTLLSFVLVALLVLLDVAGWPLATRTFNRERLILGTRLSASSGLPLTRAFANSGLRTSVPPASDPSSSVPPASGPSMSLEPLAIVTSYADARVQS